jgi:hypothetical protein
MIKKFALSIAMITGLLFSIQTLSYSQTAAELKAEREQLKAEMKAAATLERQDKISKLTAPKSSGVKSVDDLAISSAAMLLASAENNKVIPELYKRTIGETLDGVTDVTVKKPELAELETLAANIATQTLAVSKASEAVSAASGDVSKAGPMQAPKATKALNYTKDTLALLGPELQMNAKVVKNLIATLKSAKNY